MYAVAGISTNRELSSGHRGTSYAHGAGVQGAITSRDVLLNSVTIVRLWGPAFYVRCLRAIASGRSCTFLEVLASHR
jgi:hypothetical protein